MGLAVTQYKVHCNQSCDKQLSLYLGLDIKTMQGIHVATNGTSLNQQIRLNINSDTEMLTIKTSVHSLICLIHLSHCLVSYLILFSVYQESDIGYF